MLKNIFEEKKTTFMGVITIIVIVQERRYCMYWSVCDCIHHVHRQNYIQRFRKGIVFGNGRI